jgi:calcineurin-like phosphoesterase family protein
MNDVWFTSDTHFDHPNVAVGHRGFASSHQHDETLIALWNAKVKPDDVVWHLGDVGRGKGSAGHAEYVLSCVGRLNGVKHLVAGNHDAPHPLHRDSHKHQRLWLTVFESVQPFARRYVGGDEVLLSHFPYTGDHGPLDRHTQFRLPDEGLPLIHGHLHADRKVEGLQVNAGVDVWGFAPVHLDEIASLLK